MTTNTKNQKPLGVMIAPGAANPSAVSLINDEVKEILMICHRELNGQRLNLLAERKNRQKKYDAGRLPTFEEYHPASEQVWKVAPIPEDLLERRVEITGPINNTKMVINMLSRTADGARADMAMLDFEDSMKPNWNNVIDGVLNIIGVAQGDLKFVQPGNEGKPEKIYQINPQDMAHPMVRIRGLHLEEANLACNGENLSAGMVDLVLTAYHTAKTFINNGMTPKFYVPKVEHYLEARWWHTLFSLVEARLGIENGTLRTTLLIETLPATYQMEEILYEIRGRCVGLNGGRWDKIFSDIKVLRNHPDRILSDRSSIDMSKEWMDNYAKRLIKICHMHGAFAMGGMSAFTPGKDPQTREQQLEKVRQDKAREADIGHDGCWVSHPFFIGMAREQFRKKNQLDVVLCDFPKRPELLPRPEGPKTLDGLRTNVRVGIAYQFGWDHDLGCIAWDGLMEDLATLEISRAQTWQWLHHKIKLDDGIEVTNELVARIFDEECEKIIKEVSAELKEAGRDEIINKTKEEYLIAKNEAKQLFLQEELSDFFSMSSNVVSTNNMNSQMSM